MAHVPALARNIVLNFRVVIMIEFVVDDPVIERKQHRKRPVEKCTDRLEPSEKSAARTKKRKSKLEGPFKRDFPSCQGRWTTTITNDYTVATLTNDQSGSPRNVSVVGVDIGKIHTGICGVDCTSLTKGGWPRITAIALVNGGDKIAHVACDRIDEILVTSGSFKWFRQANATFIEQQLPINPQAKQVAQGLRTMQRTLKLMKGKSPDVHFVSGQLKYKIAPMIAPKSKDDDLRNRKLSGAKNKPLRKLLGERDVYNILLHTEQLDCIHMIASMCKSADQIHDVTDAILVALAGELINSDRNMKLEGTPYADGSYIVRKKNKRSKK